MNNTIQDAPGLTARLRWSWKRIATSIKYHGIPFTALWLVVYALRLTRAKWFEAYRARQFDRRYGIETADAIQLPGLGLTPSDAELSIHYEPSRPEILSEVLSTLPVRYQDYVFVDLGSGKGMALLVASMFPFRRIVGVEWSRRVARIARGNVSTFYHPQQQCRDIEILDGDATAYKLPPEPIVIYMFNPFKEPLVRRVLHNLGKSLAECPRHVVVIYHNPVYIQAFAGAEFLHQSTLRDDTLVAVYETRRGAPQRPGEGVQYSGAGAQQVMAAAEAASAEEVAT